MASVAVAAAPGLPVNASTLIDAPAYAAPQAAQPDITYQPDREKWQARTARRLAENPSLLSSALPEGFPKKLDSPLVWEGKDWTDEKQWVYELDADELKELDDAARHFHSKSHQSFVGGAEQSSDVNAPLTSARSPPRARLVLDVPAPHPRAKAGPPGARAPLRARVLRPPRDPR